jgi:hypothetical protein
VLTQSDRCVEGKAAAWFDAVDDEDQGFPRSANSFDSRSNGTQIVRRRLTRYNDKVCRADSLDYLGPDRWGSIHHRNAAPSVTQGVQCSGQPLVRPGEDRGVGLPRIIPASGPLHWVGIHNTHGTGAGYISSDGEVRQQSGLAGAPFA